MILSRNRELSNTQKKINKIRVRRKGVTTTLVVNPTRKQDLNSREVDLLMTHKYEVLLGVEMSPKKLSYNISGMTSLDKVLAAPLSVEEMYKILEELVSMLKQVQESYLQANNVLVDLEHIFVDPRSGKLRFVYLPILAYPNKTDFIVFFRNFVNSVTLIGGTDQMEIRKLKECLANMVVFSIHDMERLVLSALNPPKENPWEAKIINAMKTGAVVQVCRRCKATNDGTGRYCSCCGQALEDSIDELFYKPEEQKKSGVSQPQQRKLPRTDMSMPRRKTVHTSGDLKNDLIAPCLFHVRIGSRVQLNKREVVLGKASAMVDYVVTGNAMVSRVHAKVLNQNGRYYIVDMGSRNGTFVNGRKLSEGVPCELFEGQQIKLGNEVFIFDSMSVEHDDTFADYGTTVL